MLSYTRLCIDSFDCRTAGTIPPVPVPHVRGHVLVVKCS